MNGFTQMLVETVKGKDISLPPGLLYSTTMVWFMADPG